MTVRQLIAQLATYDPYKPVRVLVGDGDEAAALIVKSVSAWSADDAEYTQLGDDGDVVLQLAGGDR